MSQTQPPPSSPSEAPTAQQQSKTKLLLKLAVVPVLIVAGLAALKFTPLGELMTGERIIAVLEGLRNEPWTPLLLIGGLIATGPFGLPVSPLIIGSGAVFGPWMGTLYNSIGLMGNCLLTYSIGKSAGREAVTRFTGPKFRRAERLLGRRGFWPLIQIRFMPVPAPVTNYAAALAGVPLGRFMLTSALGLIPSCAVHTYFAPALIYAVLEGRNPTWLTVQYAAVLIILNLAILWPQVQTAVRRRRRYRELTEQRRDRASSRPSS